MTMDLKQFKTNVLVHGSDVRNWPEDIRESGQRALDSSAEFRALLGDEERFEAVLKTRRYEEPDRDLAERIISASVYKKKKAQHIFRGFFSDLLWEFSLPGPARTAVFVSLIVALIIGFAVGFSDPTGTMPAEQYQANLEDFLYYEGEVL
jgi:hypothetical protein